MLKDIKILQENNIINLKRQFSYGKIQRHERNDS